MEFSVSVNFVVEADSDTDVEKLVDDIVKAYSQIKDSEIEDGPTEIVPDPDEDDE